jgi:hypothetical protein
VTLPQPVLLTLGREPLSELVAALRQVGVRFNAYAEELLAGGRVAVAPEPTPVRVEVHTIGALGWAEGATLDQVLRDVTERGLLPCPLEVALLLRLAWREQPVSPRITVASARAQPDEARPRGFYLRDDADGCWLRAFVASDDWVMGPEERLAFLRRSSP